MSATLTREELAVSIRSMIKNQEYRETPIGETVGRYIRWLRNERGATTSTVRDYEAVLARMSIVLHDLELIEVTTEDLRGVIDLWQERAPKTRAKITSIVHAFFRWCYEEGILVIDPSLRIRRPKVEKRVARRLPLDAKPRLLEAATVPRDRLGLYCLLGLGLRRGEMADIQVRDFDLLREELVVFGKGLKERRLPLPELLVTELKLFLQDDLPAVGRPPEIDDYLLYPIDRRASGKGPEGQILWSFYGRPKDKPSGQCVWRWWKKRAKAGGLMAEHETSGLGMHRARHTFAMELRRVAGIEAASQFLGHSDLSTTLGIYGHQDDSDLRTAMDAHTKWEREQ